MDELQKNIEQLVAKKVLKDIDEIVQFENKKEKKEFYWAKVVVGFMLLVIIVLVLIISL